MYVFRECLNKNEYHQTESSDLDSNSSGCPETVDKVKQSEQVNLIHVLLFCFKNFL